MGDLDEIRRLDGLLAAERAECERMRRVYLAAMDWHAAPHVDDADHAAGDCDDCPARVARIKLERACKEAK